MQTYHLLIIKACRCYTMALMADDPQYYIMSRATEFSPISTIHFSSPTVNIPAGGERCYAPLVWNGGSGRCHEEEINPNNIWLLGANRFLTNRAPRCGGRSSPHGDE